MSDEGLEQARAKMEKAGVDPVAIEVFAHYYRLVESGETGMIPEATIDPVDMPALADVGLPTPTPVEGLAGTAVIKLNGGLGTSMGLDRAKSLLEARDGLSFLDIIARQVLWARREYDVTLPLIFMNSFRTSQDTTLALAGYADLPVPELPLDFLQNKEPKLLAEDLTPVSWEKDPDLEWCPPGHGDLYTALRGSGLLDRLIDAGYSQAFVSNSDNLGATPDPEVAEWFAQSGARFASTNNLWFDLRAMREELAARDGILGLTLIKNVKTVDPADATTPEVIQIETAMGAAIEVFDGAALIEVRRQRFLPVKTTNDLLVLRSDCYRLGDGYQLIAEDGSGGGPFLDLDSRHYKLVQKFDQRFPEGVPSMRQAEELVVNGDWTFEGGVTVVGRAHLDDPGKPSRVKAGSTLG